MPGCHRERCLSFWSLVLIVLVSAGCTEPVRAPSLDDHRRPEDPPGHTRKILSIDEAGNRFEKLKDRFDQVLNSLFTKQNSRSTLGRIRAELRDLLKEFEPVQQRCSWYGSAQVLLRFLEAPNWLLKARAAERIPRQQLRPVLEHVEELAAIARMASSGGLGCGIGSYSLVGEDGRTIGSVKRAGLDPYHVFGREIHVEDLLTLLRARAESNRTGKGPMARDVSSLCYVCLSVLSRADLPQSIPVIVNLLTDEQSTIRNWSEIALEEIGRRNPELLQVILDHRSSPPEH